MHRGRLHAVAPNHQADQPMALIRRTAATDARARVNPDPRSPGQARDQLPDGSRGTPDDLRPTSPSVARSSAERPVAGASAAGRWSHDPHSQAVSAASVRAWPPQTDPSAPAEDESPAGTAPPRRVAARAIDILPRLAATTSSQASEQHPKARVQSSERHRLNLGRAHLLVRHDS